MRLINKLLFCLAAGIPAVALAACSSGGSSGGVASGPPPEQSTIVIDMVPTADAAGVYIAQDDGYFAQQGLTVKIVPINGGEYGIGDLQTGKAQLIEGNYVSFILAQIAGTFAAPNPNNPTQTEPTKPINMRLIADSSQMQPGNQGLYVLPSSPYRTVQQLVAHHVAIGVNTLHNIGTVLLGSLLASDGYKVSALAQSPQILPLMPMLLAQHKISAAWLPEPFATEAQQDYGAVQLADFDQGSLQDFPLTGYLGSTQWVHAHPDTVAAFLRALTEGQALADTDRAALESAIEQYTDVPPVIAGTMAIDSYPLAMDVPQLQRVADSMYEFGLTPGAKAPYQVARMIQQEPGLAGG